MSITAWMWSRAMLKIACPLGQILVDELVLKNRLICSKTKSWPNLCTAATSELVWMVSKDPKGIFFFPRDEVNNESKWNLNSGWASGYFFAVAWMKEELWENLICKPQTFIHQYQYPSVNCSFNPGRTSGKLKVFPMSGIQGWGMVYRDFILL